MAEMAEFIIIDDEFDEHPSELKSEENSNILNRGNVNGTDYVVTFASPGQSENSGYITPDLDSIESSNSDASKYRASRSAGPVPSDPLGGWVGLSTRVGKPRCTSEYAQWSKAATLVFIEAYQTISSKTKNITRQKLWEQVSGVMLNHGFNYTTAQCSAKYKTLIRQYRAVKAFNSTHSNQKREWQYYDIMDSVVSKSTKNSWGTTNNSWTKSPEAESITENSDIGMISLNESSTSDFGRQDLPIENVEQSNTTEMTFSNGPPKSKSDSEDSLPEENLKKKSTTSNTAKTSRKVTVKGLLQKLINQKAKHEKARRQRHEERMESDDRLYRILERLANK